jgi:hypothetical protein
MRLPEMCRSRNVPALAGPGVAASHIQSKSHMKVFASTNRPGAMSIGLRVAIAALVAVLTGIAAAALAARSSARVRAEDSVDALALKWFAQMQTGQIDRTQLSAQYGAQLTDDALREMSCYLKEHSYGTSPTRAEVMRNQMIGEQKFYLVKLVFPRGDAASLLFGFNAEGKITGVTFLSMAGD